MTQFPYLDYITVDIAFQDQVSGTLYTTLYKSEITVELINAGTSGEYYDATVFATQTLPINITTNLLVYTASGSHPLETYTSVVESGSPIKMVRGSQFGQTLARLHIKRLPESI